MARRRGIGVFARECLAPASKACEGKKGRAFHVCRKDFIAKCKIEKGFV